MSNTGPAFSASFFRPSGESLLSSGFAPPGEDGGSSFLAGEVGFG